MIYTPVEIETVLSDVFGFPEVPTFAQVATHDENGPVCRTMKLFAMTDDKEPVFLSHTDSLKWQQLLNAP